jgi:hypothetical protein
VYNTNLLTFGPSAMDENIPSQQICSKSKCRTVLPPVIPGQRWYKTCQKCRDQNRIYIKRKREGEHPEEPRPAPDPLPRLQSLMADVQRGEAWGDQSPNLARCSDESPSEASDEKTVSRIIFS